MSSVKKLGIVFGMVSIMLLAGCGRKENESDETMATKNPNMNATDINIMSEYNEWLEKANNEGYVLSTDDYNDAEKKDQKNREDFKAIEESGLKMITCLIDSIDIEKRILKYNEVEYVYDNQVERMKELGLTGADMPNGFDIVDEVEKIEEATLSDGIKIFRQVDAKYLLKDNEKNMDTMTKHYVEIYLDGNNIKCIFESNMP
jgi:major membrane immunogen (membrane-anchored lipoprotein)